jgi:hypothetical protein
VRGNLLIALLCTLCVVACGGGGSALSGGSGPSGGGSTGTSNVQSVVIDSGPSLVANSNTPALNTLYTTVTICVPGSTTNCQTIDHIQVDTGSSGFRILANNAGFSLSLPNAKDSTGSNDLAECVPFVDGSSYGSIRLADIKIAGEVASNIAIQVIGDSAYPVPTDGSCPGTQENTVQTFGANGILGVGVFISDCGPTCSSYYTCPTPTTCSLSTTVAEAQQVSNPVASFAGDNNGVIIQVPTISSGGAASATGSLIFGIGTQSNNGLASGVKIFNVTESAGNFLTVYNNFNMPESVVDSGSNGLFFNSSITPCPDGSGFYCPNPALNQAATMQGVDPNTGVATSTSENITFTVADEATLLGGSVIAAAPGLSGQISSSSDPQNGFDPTKAFDWGLPFFFGRSVYTAIEGKTAGSGTGPYIAF